MLCSAGATSPPPRERNRHSHMDVGLGHRFPCDTHRVQFREFAQGQGYCLEEKHAVDEPVFDGTLEIFLASHAIARLMSIVVLR